MKSPQITLKMNGSTDALFIDGHTFDRSMMTPQQRRGLRTMVIEAMFGPQTMESHAPRRRSHRGRRGAR